MSGHVAHVQKPLTIIYMDHFPAQCENFLNAGVIVYSSALTPHVIGVVSCALPQLPLTAVQYLRKCQGRDDWQAASKRPNIRRIATRGESLEAEERRMSAAVLNCVVHAQSWSHSCGH
jgi:hypothetical protein